MSLLSSFNELKQMLLFQGRILDILKKKGVLTNDDLQDAFNPKETNEPKKDPSPEGAGSGS